MKLLLVLMLFACHIAHAAEVGLTVSIPPELVLVILKWRAEHGYPPQPLPKLERVACDSSKPPLVVNGQTRKDIDVNGVCVITRTSL